MRISDWSADVCSSDLPDQIKQLRQTILNLAVRGKLVPQDPNDEPASELLKRIAKEKARLVKAGKIREGLLEDSAKPKSECVLTPERKSVLHGESVLVLVDTGGRGTFKNKTTN